MTLDQLLATNPGTPDGLRAVLAEEVRRGRVLHEDERSQLLREALDPAVLVALAGLSSSPLGLLGESVRLGDATAGLLAHRGDGRVLRG